MTILTERPVDEKELKKTKLLVLTGIIVLVFIIYVLRLFSLQVIEVNENRDNSRRISTRITEIPSQRGEIYDRNKTYSLVVNADSFAVEITPDDIPPEYYDTVLAKLAALLGVSKKQIEERLPKDAKTAHYYGQSFEVKTNVSLRGISNIAENITDLPGVSWKNKPIRKYVETGSLSHVIGYVGNIGQDELEERYNKGYKNQTVIGKTGLELKYDEFLQGKNGREIRTIDAEGRVISSTSSIEPPQSGNNLILTIDSSIQRLAEEALGERVGSAIVLRPYDGEILAMASYPFYDANIFSTDDSRKEYVKLIKNL